MSVDESVSPTVNGDAEDKNNTIENEGSTDAELPKKRKRDKNEENLEVDLSLPEPPSKKALRKAKKDKKSSKSKDEPEASALPRAEIAPAVEENSIVHSESEPKEPISTKAKSAHSIWIGNLPFLANKPMLTEFLTSNSQPPIPRKAITRIHIPAPSNAAATKTKVKPQNKGFAYVDFADVETFTAALALSEQVLGGRNLLIKDARSFEGRPQDHQKAGKSGTNKNVSRRIFIGNLGFDVTEEELRSFFEVCGAIEHLKMATFEDSGKCKGFAWITFADIESAVSAVKGVVTKLESDDEEAGDDEDAKAKKRKPQKRQLFCNRLHGREVRREFAEDSTTRYKKRYGKDRRAAEVEEPAVEEVKIANEPKKDPHPPKRRSQTDEIHPGESTDPSKRRGKGKKPPMSEAAQDIVEKTRYRSGQITGLEGTGAKVTFD